jgi:hypothetical protein
MTKMMLGWLSGLLVVCALAGFPGHAAEKVQHYTNQRYGFSISLSEEVRVYTPDNPGPFTFEERNILFLVNKWKPSDLIVLNRSAITDEVELDNFKLKMESEGLPQPGYRKVSVGYISIGENPPKRAVEHIFELRGPVARTMRYVYFIHKGQGFAFVSISNPERFEDINKNFFEPVFRSVRFE